MNTISTTAMAFAAKRTGVDHSLLAITLLSSFGLIVSLALMASGIDLNIGSL